MKNYIVFDLEWNQSPRGKADSVEDFPFEIIEIGAVKMDEQFHIVEEFHRLIRPQVYEQIHFAISEVTHMKMEELKRHGEDFATAARDFIAWCGEDAIFCTWGPMDLTELQRNLRYYQMDNPFPKPLFYYDVQKLYALFCNAGVKPSLDAAVSEMALLEDRGFHRALDDAYYTAKILAEMAQEEMWEYRSVDYYRLPENEAEEITMIFPNYSKYVSRIFATREEAMEEHRVTEMRCYECKRLLRKKIRWFTPNQKNYYALAWCPEHGYLKGKIRIKRVDDLRVYVVKTLKLVDEAGADEIYTRKQEVRKKRAERNRAKRQRERTENRAKKEKRQK